MAWDPFLEDPKTTEKLHSRTQGLHSKQEQLNSKNNKHNDAVIHHCSVIMCKFKQETGNIYLTGVAFPFVKALHNALDQTTEEPFKFVLIPSNGQDLDYLRNSIDHYNLNIDICKLTGEKPLIDFLSEVKPVLYLSTNPQNVREAIHAGHGAATMFQRDNLEHNDDDVFRVAFDGDGVLFSDESERITKENGLDQFFKHEEDNKDQPLPLGPLAVFFQALVDLQEKYKLRNIRTYLVTSRGFFSPGVRALITLRENKLLINEAFFLSGSPKGPVLKAIKPHIFFDDQMLHVDGALQNGVTGAHVPYGVRNQRE